jgi:RHS repeat-associated protein
MQSRSSKDSDSNSADPDKSYFSAPPTVTLPKGGGAIKGMGEKFAANPVTGTGSMSVPIATSPGRSGFGPQLSLSYDSGAGNGMFGLGWNLSLPSITRKTDKGLPRYWDGEESDVFVLSGAEDLVPVLKADGTVDETLRDGYRIRKYRPRIEGLFARIECWTKLDSGETHWRSISKDNITTLYGKTAESRIADPGDPTHVFSWSICESYDDKGNAIRYEYKVEDSDGVARSQPHERNRTPKSRAVNCYLKHIRYGNQTPRKPNEDLSLRTDWLFEVVFDYGAHDLTNPKPNDSGIWTVRNDPFSSYRAGFEVRTYRLCQRVLMFHHFPAEAEVGRDCLVRSTDFNYSYEQNPKDARNPIYSFLLSVSQTGYKRNPAGGYIQKSLPPLEFTYSEAIIDETVRDVDPVSLENLPQGLDGARYQWVDLDGEGLSGILTEQGGGWFYKRNLSPINAVPNGSKHIEASFAPVELVASKPAGGLANGAQFLDLAGDGQPDVVMLRGAPPGFYERTQDEDWESFVAFKSLPVLDWDNPNLKFIDLNGDGHSDILISEDNCFVWHPSLAEDGFAAAERVSQSWDEEKGPRVVFADSTQSIHLADMSGDGLTDIVRIRNGEVCYWPNLGYGRFGAKVTMDDAPWFDRPDIFDQRRIQLADIDGSGTTDILYLSGEGVQVYFNQSGNSWATKRTLSYFPAIDSVASITAIDLLGNGTACLVWSSPLPGNGRRMMRYIDLMGGQKPNLLIKTVNNLGAETVVQYAPSTKFYLQDKFAGLPWITKLPFPVHVVERVETYDRISRNRFVTRYGYHHGYFDGVEREFRGFGRVDQWDTEEIGTIQTGDTTSDSTNLDMASFVPPVLTKTWFHTGAYFGREKISQQFEHEYYREPKETDQAFAASLLPDTILPAGLMVEEEREAARSLKGHILRLEIYALDGSDKQPHPYSVSERNYEIRLEQGLQTNRHAVFFAHDRETIDYHYERNPADPRVTHAMTLEVDEFGNGLKSVAIAYPRRKPAYPEQGKTFITYTENQVTNKPNDKLGDPDWYRIGVAIETRTYDIAGVPAPTGKYFALADFYQKVADGSVVGHITAPEIPYETIPTNTSPQKRLIERVRTLYRKDSEASTTDPAPLPLGQIDSLALPCESFKLAFTPGLLAQVYGSKLTDLSTLLGAEGKYMQQDGGWWISSGRQGFDSTQFYLPVQIKDPFGNLHTSTYDRYHLSIIRTVDPLNNTIAIQNNYRTLQPEQITDPNGNRSQARFDALGMVVGTAVMGKASETLGDAFANFNADLTQAEIKAFFDADNPRSLAINHLGTSTTRIIYDLERTPVCAAAIARETHVSDQGGGQTRVQLSFVYSDGFGREAQTKVQAEPGSRDPAVANSPRLDPRWVGTGAKVYNNKGKPVRQYEPFFSPTHHFGIEQWGVSSTLFYDPVERVVATLHPNHTYEKVVFDPWQQATYDVNDTVTFDPKNDPDIGRFLTRLSDADYLPSWYQQRINGFLGTEEQSAAEKAATHADTPTIAHFDTLGRAFLTVADNGAAGKYETRVELDIEGNQRSVTDALGRKVMVYDYDLLGHRIHQASMEAGERWMLNNVAGKPIRAWDSRGHTFRTEYDPLLRPLRSFVTSANAANPNQELLTDRIIYGEQHPNNLQRNLRGKLYLHLDQAGALASETYDFKGNLLSSSRRIVREYKQVVNWSGVDAVLPADATAMFNATTLEATLNAQLEAETFTSRTTYDALNRPIQLIAPHSSLPGASWNIIQPRYNEANLLEQLDVWLERLTEPAEQIDVSVVTPSPVGVNNIDYDTKGQRLRIDYKNGATTRYTYDPETFRLIHLYTRRGAAFTNDCVSDPPPPNTPCGLQNLHYTYDPVGNITHIRDDAQQTIYFSNQVVEPNNEYTYDPIYRLIQATGREHLGQVGGAPAPHSYNDVPRVGINWSANDVNAMGRYCETYGYDAVGNFMEMSHRRSCLALPSWTRTYTYDENSQIEPSQKSNRLSSTRVGSGVNSVPEPYSYDAHGNMLQMPQLQIMQWDFRDQLQMTQRQAVNASDSDGVQRQGERTYYVYDAGGQRVRKVTELATGQVKDECIYLGGFEVYRCYSGQNSGLVRETLHVMDDKQRIALVETRNNVNDGSPRLLIRYQFGNHLGSASLELSEQAQIISYEEYAPYGSSTYQAARSLTETPKRYRYTGKERDEESGLYYHGARYCAPWLGRWTSCDPLGTTGSSLYTAFGNNPPNRVDPLGTSERPPNIDSKETMLRQMKEEETIRNPRLYMRTPEEEALQQRHDNVLVFDQLGVTMTEGTYKRKEEFIRNNALLEIGRGSFFGALTSAYARSRSDNPADWMAAKALGDAAMGVLGGVAQMQQARSANIAVGGSKVPDTRPMQWGAPTVQKTRTIEFKIESFIKQPKEIADAMKEFIFVKNPETGRTLPRNFQVAITTAEIDGKRVSVATFSHRAAWDLVKQGHVKLPKGVDLEATPPPYGKLTPEQHVEIRGINILTQRGVTGGDVSTSGYACDKYCGPDFTYNKYPGWTHHRIDPTKIYEPR